MKKQLAVIVALTATPVAAQDCDHIVDSKNITVAGQVLGPWPVLVGGVKIDFDYAKQTVCLKNTSNPFLGVKITPEKFCFNMAQDKEVIYAPELKFVNGVKAPHEQLTKTYLRKIYDGLHEACLRPAVKAPEAKVESNML